MPLEHWNYSGTNQNSLTFTMNANYTNMLHYYCTKSGHVGMVNSLNTSVPPVSENQLIITEISPNDDLVEVTYFDSRTAELTRDFWFTVDGFPASFIPEGTVFEEGESKTFSVQLIAVDQFGYTAIGGATYGNPQPMMCGLSYGITEPAGDIHSTNAYEKLRWESPQSFAYFSGASNSLRLAAFDATNPDYWIESESDFNSFMTRKLLQICIQIFLPVQ